MEPTALNELQSLSVQSGQPLHKSRTVSVRDGVAVIPIHGIITARYDWLTFALGGTALDVLAKDFQIALDDPEIHSIVFDVDSPGGVAIGPSEMADMIFNARGKKPIVAYAGRNCCSAAYWLASACDKIIAHSSAALGSIGVVSAVPVQEQPDQDGYRTIEIVSSNAMNKRPDPRTPEGLSEIRKELDALETQFIESIAKHRNLSPEAVKSNFGGGGVLIGQDAVNSRMADDLGSFESVLQSLTNQRKETIMDEKEHYDRGRAAENKRIMDIEQMSLPGHETLVAAAKADLEMTASMLAVQIIAAEKEKGGRYLATMKTNEAELPKVSAISDMPPEATTKSEWDKSSNFRAEFGTFEAYKAFKDAETAGQVKILKGN